MATTLPPWMTYSSMIKPESMQPGMDSIPSRFVTVGNYEGTPTYDVDQEAYNKWLHSTRQEPQRKEAYDAYTAQFQTPGDTVPWYTPEAGKPPKWGDFFTRYEQALESQRGYGFDRPWAANTDLGSPSNVSAAKIKAQIDRQFVDALNKYNQTFGTNFQPNTEFMGPEAQPNPYIQREGSAEFGGFIGKNLGTIGGIAGGVLAGPIGAGIGASIGTGISGGNPTQAVKAGGTAYALTELANQVSGPTGAEGTAAGTTGTGAGITGMSDIAGGTPIMSAEYVAAHPEVYATGLFGTNFGGTQSPAPIEEASVMPGAGNVQAAGGTGKAATMLKSGSGMAQLLGAGLGLLGGKDGGNINTSQQGTTDATQVNTISYSPEEMARRTELLRKFPELYAHSAGLYDPAASARFSTMLDQGIQYGMDARDPAQNPFVQKAIENAIRPVTQAYLDPNGVLANIRSSALGAGQYGGTRQGLQEGIAAGRYADAVGGISANMMNNAYNQGQNTFAQILTAAPALKGQAADAQQKQIWGPALTYGDLMKSLQTPTTTTKNLQNSTGTATQPGQQSNPLGDALAGAVMGNYLYKSFM